MPERVIRFGVRNDFGLRSGTWRCWWNGAADDLSFYVASRQLVAGDFKLSFHQTGVCHVSFSQQTYERFEEGAAPPDRYLEEWKRPEPFRPGLARVCNVVVPSGSAREQMSQGDENSVRWVHDPRPGTAIEFGVLVAGSGPDIWNGIHLIDSFRLPNGDSIGVAYNIIPYVAPPPAQVTPRFVEGGREML